MLVKKHRLGDDTITIMKLITTLLVVTVLTGCSSEKEWPDLVKIEVESSDRVLLSEPVKFKVSLNNPTDKTLQIHHGANVWDFLVTREKDGIQVWSWGFERAYLLYGATITLAPGETIACEFYWDQKGYRGVQESSGNYSVIGFFRGTVNRKSAPTVAIELKSKPHKFVVEGKYPPTVQTSNLGTCRPAPSWGGGG